MLLIQYTQILWLYSNANIIYTFIIILHVINITKVTLQKEIVLHTGS